MNIYKSDNRIDFTIKKLADVFEGYQLTKERIQPDGEWANFYKIISIGPKKAVNQGALTIVRRLKDAESASFSISCVRNVIPGYFQFINAELKSELNLVSSPIWWEYSMKTASSPEAKPYLGSGLTKKAVVKDRELRLTTGGKTKSVPIVSDYTCKWCLFDVIQRLPYDEAEPIKFDIIDEFDQVKKDNILSFYGKTEQIIDGKMQKLTAYLLTGRGVLPTIYFRDEYARLLFVVAGLEIYMLTSLESMQV